MANFERSRQPNGGLSSMENYSTLNNRTGTLTNNHDSQRKPSANKPHLTMKVPN